jgi:hypothetical protein
MRGNMRLVMMFMGLLLPTAVLAQTSLHAVSDTAFQKDLYIKSSEKSIEGGAPVDGQSFTLKDNGKTLGTFIAGSGFNAQDENVCFVGWSKKSPVIHTLIPTIGYDDWEAEKCNKTKSVGVISDNNNPATKIAVIYEASSPNAIADESVIFSVVSSTGDLELDSELTKKIGSSGARTIKELKAKYLDK